MSKVISNWGFESIEGNTNKLGSREGITVARKQRKILSSVMDGLRVLGFVHVPPPITLTLNV